MGNLVIVAIPEEQDRVWKISSEKVPHLTLLFLGDADSNPNVQKIMEFVQHAVDVTEHGQFYLDVDRRDVLGSDEADVVFFSKRSWNLKWIKQFRSQLLQNDAIRTAYDSTEQFPEWQPHLTLGYPTAPANELDGAFDHPIYSVCFDRIAVWTGDFDGPEFRLEWPDRELSDDLAVAYSGTGKSVVDNLLHVGVKGMRWGQRKSSEVTPTSVEVKTTPHNRKTTKIEAKGGGGHDAHPDAIKVTEARQKLRKSGSAALSNSELKDVAERLQLESNVARLEGERKSGSTFVGKLLRKHGSQQLDRGINRAAGQVTDEAATQVGRAATKKIFKAGVAAAV